MALNLSKTGIVDGQVITAAQITQSIDALTGTAAYDITVSGSFVLNGGTTGSGTFNSSIFCTSASLAQTASYFGGSVSQFAPSYTDISSGTNPPANPYNVVIGNKSFVFLNQIGAGSVGLLFLPSSQDGQIVNFAVSNVQATSLDYAAISITSSGITIFGYNNLNIPPGLSNTLGNIIVNPAANYRNGFQFIYKTTPAPGWYYVSYGQ
jgi:hypothetical protein